MVSERVQRHIDRLLDAADEAMVRSDWAAVRDPAQDILALDPDNSDARTFLAAAERRIGDSSPSPTVDDTVSAVRTPTPEPSPTHPTTFVNGRYTVKRFLGEGGKMKVYLCHDTLLDRDVAFALIKAQGLDAEGLARVRREAQAMGRLGDHPHIVTLFEIGDEDGPSTGSGGPQPYLVSQLMAGGDVEGLIDKADGHRLPLDQALRIADQMCQALEHAHANGLVLRDLKPGNVWLTADPSAGSGQAPGTGAGQAQIAKLGDFGLAVALGRTRLTQAGMMVGTVSYMPPEQAMGGEPTPRSDLYSLGAMVYEMVAGRPPFVGEASVAIIGQHINTPPVAPSWHAPHCPPALEALILRLLAKAPADRPASAAEVRQTLAEIDLTPQPPSLGGKGEANGRGLGSANPLDRLARGVFIGRADELAQGRAAVDGALSGRVSLLLLAGERGIGKTRLAEEIATYASLRGALVLSGRIQGAEGAPAYWPFVQALRGYVRNRDAERLRSELGSAGPEVAKLVSEVRDRLPDLPPATVGDPAQERFRLFDAVSSFLRHASAAQPLVSRQRRPYTGRTHPPCNCSGSCWRRRTTLGCCCWAPFRT